MKGRGVVVGIKVGAKVGGSTEIDKIIENCSNLYQIKSFNKIRGVYDEQGRIKKNIWEGVTFHFLEVFVN